MSPVLERLVIPANAQVELSAVDALTYPQWATGTEASVADASTVAIATRHEMEDPVRITVGEDLGPAVTEQWSLVFEGVLMSTSERYRVGSGINADLFDAPILAKRMRVRVFVRPLIEPVDIAFETIADPEPS